jgi:photosystem II stability/assembly factor-like uncharacterized protein
MRMSAAKRLLLVLFLVLAPANGLVAGPSPQDAARSPLLDSWERYLKLKGSSEFGLEWISLGPVMNSARVEAVQLDPAHPGTMYAAFGSGNLWKTVNGGLAWKPIFENQPALGIGDIALAPSNPQVIWLGSGESLKKARNFTMPGTGVFRSDDGGETWRNLGLHDSYHIGEIAVHPHDPDIAFVAVLGHFWSTNPNRGLYRTLDGGASWEHVIRIDEKTGANDVVIAASDPDVVYASMWENNPTIYGPGSGVYKSEDGGGTWRRLGGGLPDGPKTGRIGLAVSWSNPKKVYALVDNLNRDERLAAEVYRSDDGGTTWKRAHEEELLIFPGIGWYFADIYVNPMDDDEIFALGVRMAHSADGGRTFDLVGGDVFHLVPNPAEVLHLDHCELWIDPLDPNHLALGNDGGLYVSRDKGSSWLHLNNIPAGEFYDISVDNRTPFNVYGGVQDDASVYGPAREWNPLFADGWHYVWLDAWAGGDGCVTFPDPEDPNTVYFSSQNGGARRKDMAAGRSVSIRPRLPRGHEGELRFNFVAPYFPSPHDPKVLYHAGNYVFKSPDRGDSWTLISPDLAKSSDPARASEAAGAVAESPISPGVLYLGTDRGAFWVTTDDGKKWVERSEGLPNVYVRSICPSRFKRARVYAALTGINYDDLGCHLFVSEDDGRSWASIAANLPDETSYVILEDPKNENILYAGLYRGVYISVDRGRSWALLGPGLAATAVSDLAIQEREMELVAGTHGRGIYRTNIRPIQEAFKDGSPTGDILFEIPVAPLPWINDTHRDPRLQSVEKVPITFYLTKESAVTLSVNDAKGEVLWSRDIRGKKGFNQVRWDLIVQTVDSPQPYFTQYRRFIPAGEYEVRIAAEGIDLRGRLRVEARKSPPG